MQQLQVFFWFLPPALLVFGVTNLFFTERFFYWKENQKYAYPLEPSAFKIRAMRVNGTMQVLLGLFLAYVGISL